MPQSSTSWEEGPHEDPQRYRHRGWSPRPNVASLDGLSPIAPYLSPQGQFVASIESCELPENSLATTIPPDITPPQETTPPWVHAVPHRHLLIASMDGNSDQAPLVPEPDIASIYMSRPNVRVASMDATDPCHGGDATSPQPYVAVEPSNDSCLYYSIDRSHYSVQRQVLIASMDMQDSQDVSETAPPHPYVAR